MGARRSSPSPRPALPKVVILHRHIGLIQLGGLDLFRLGAPHADTDSAIRSFALYDASVNAPNRRSNRAHVLFVDLPGLTHRAKLRPAPWRSKRRVYVIVAHHPNSPSSASPSRSRAGQTSIFSSPVPRKVSLAWATVFCLAFSAASSAACFAASAVLSAAV